MPLSEHERRLLAQMEEALAADDPRLVSAMSGTSGVSRNRLGIGVALVIAGLAILIGGLIAQITVIGLGGFLTALTGSILIFRAVTAPGALVSAAQSSPLRTYHRQCYRRPRLGSCGRAISAK